MPDKGLLYDFLPNEVAAPAAVWSRIETELDNAEVHAYFNQFADLEEVPPPQVWSKIESGLDEAETAHENEESQTESEAEHPHVVWKNIQQALDRTANTKLSPAKKITKSIWFGAVAAACIGIVFLVAPMIKNNNEKKAMASNVTTSINPALADTNVTIKKSNIRIDPTVQFPKANTIFIKAVGPNGNKVQVSSKLKPLVKFLDDVKGVKPIDNKKPPTANELMWKQKLVTWNAMINASAANAAAINFADPIDLIQFLEKKN